MLIRLKEPLDNYHQRRADAHGYLYIVEREMPNVGRFDRATQLVKRTDMVEARSIATGVVCTLITFFTEEAHDGP